MQSRIDLSNMAASETEASNASLPPFPAPFHSAGVTNRKEHSDSGDELHDDDVIHGIFPAALRMEKLWLTATLSYSEDKQGKL
jgi:hypothetical protein